MKVKFLQVALVLLGLGVFAMAGPVTITFDSGGGNGGSPPGAVEYYPYTITVSGQGNITVACDDFVDHVTGGETYSGWESTYSDLSHTLYNGGNVAPDTQYLELAYLFDSLQPVPPNDNTENAAINYAMWELFNYGPAHADDPTLTNSGVDSSTYWLAQAAANYATANTTDLVIFSPIVTDTSGWTDGQPQEFIGEVPEPATLALLGSGLLLLGFAFRRRLQVGVPGLDAKS